MIGVITLNALLAFNLILRKYVLACAEPIFFQGARLTLAGVVILGFLYFFDKDQMRFKKKDIGLFVQASIFFSYLSYVFAVISLDDLSSARYAFMYNLAPFITAVLAYVVRGIRLSTKQVLSLLLGFIGFLPLIFTQENITIESASLVSVPGLELLFGVIAYAYGWIVVSQLVKDEGYSPFLVTGIAFLSGGIATLLTSLGFETHNDIPAVSDWPRFIIYLGSIVLIGEIISYNMYAYLLKKYSATFLAFAGFLYPIFGAAFGWLFLREKITYNFFISLVIVSTALYLYYLADRENNRKVST